MTLDQFLRPKISRKTITGYDSLEDIIASIADELFSPPERLTVPECAAKYRKLNNIGSYVGDWHNYTTPYLVEPAETLTARDRRAVIFVGPAQTGKTDALILNWITYSVIVDPMDMMVVTPTQTVSRDFSNRRINRLHRHTKEVGKRMLKRRDADNVFDKQYASGMLLNLGHPTVAELSGKPVGRVALTDRDRMDDDIEGDGDPFDLASQRTRSFRSFAMTLCESSPSRPITNPNWIRATPHQAPPTTGILALYNRGDRRRWYWPCPSCDTYFEGNFKHLVWSDMANVYDAADTVRMQCPACPYKIHPDERHEMQQWGQWVADGQYIDSQGRIGGEPPRTEIASYWMNGTAAAFTTWPNLVSAYLTAMGEFERTGSDEALKKFYNNDLGEPYLPKSMEAQRTPDSLMTRAEPLPILRNEEAEPDEGILRHVGKIEGVELQRVTPMIPEGVRFFINLIDVQKNMYVVQALGISPGMPFDSVVLDRYQIRKSRRVDADGDHEWVKPGSYEEDWELLTDLVIKRTYPLSDGSGRRMMAKATACDSGGKAGVTAAAYDYWRSLRRLGMGTRFHLIKGMGRPTAPRAKIEYPDSSDRKNKAAAQGDVPVLQLNSNIVKDQLHNLLDSLVPAKGLIRFPNWLPDWFYAEICAEIRDAKGWQKTAHPQNEAWDLLYYGLGLLISPLIGIEKLDWSKPPTWAAEWDRNSHVLAPAQEEIFAHRPQTSYDFSQLGAKMA